MSDIKDRLRKSKIAKTISQKYGLGDDFDDIIDGMSIVFDKIDVSALTNNGDVTLNIKLLDSKEDIIEYVIHEFTHVCQHIVNEGDAKKINKEKNKKYLNRKTEQEAFKFQIEQIKKDDGKTEAEEYVGGLLKHHKIRPGTKKWNTLYKLLMGEDSK